MENLELNKIVEAFNEAKETGMDTEAIVHYIHEYMEDMRLCKIAQTYLNILNMARIGGMMPKPDFQKNVYNLLKGLKQNLTIDFRLDEDDL